jgi:hypothetical protein
MDWSEIAALGTVGAAGAALTAAVIAWRVGRDQVRSAVAANGVNLAIQLRAHVNSAEFRAARHNAAGALLAGRYSSDVVYVLDELETIGLLVRRRVVDAEIVWTMVSALVVNYVAAARPLIDADRRRNPTLWANLLDLEARMLEVERKQGGTDLDASTTYRPYLEMEVREMAPLQAAGEDGAPSGAPAGSTHAGDV